MTIVCYAGPRHPCQVVASDGKASPSSKLAPYLLLGLFAILTAAIGGVTWRFYVTQKEAFERGVQTQLLTIADTKVRQIAEWRKVRLGEARSIMADTFTLAALQRVIEGRRAQPERAAVVDYLRSICANLRYAGAVLVDPEGRQVLWEGRRFGDSGHLKSRNAGSDRRPATSWSAILTRRSRRATPTWGSTCRCVPAPGRPVFGGLLLSIDPTGLSVPDTDMAGALAQRGGAAGAARRPVGALPLARSGNCADAALRLRVALSRSDVAAVMAVQGRQGNVEAAGLSGRAGFCRTAPGAGHGLVSDRQDGLRGSGRTDPAAFHPAGCHGGLADSDGRRAGAVPVAARATQPVPRTLRVRNRAPRPGGTVQLSEPLRQRRDPADRRRRQHRDGQRPGGRCLRLQP